MKPLPVERDEILGDERASGSNILVVFHQQQSANGIAAVKAHTITISGQDQQKVEQLLMLAQTGKKSISQKTVEDKAESPLNSTDPIPHNR
ncbi:MAG: hypothetical protein GY845_37515 [Planctomycetes bacterium]|nr:hypothetical protein [Planctomycetota bacterium]